MIQEKPPQIQIIVKVRALSLSSKQGDKGNGVIKNQKITGKPMLLFTDNINFF